MSQDNPINILKHSDFFKKWIIVTTMMDNNNTYYQRNKERLLEQAKTAGI